MCTKHPQMSLNTKYNARNTCKVISFKNTIYAFPLSTLHWITCRECFAIHPTCVHRKFFRNIYLYAVFDFVYTKSHNLGHNPHGKTWVTQIKVIGFVTVPERGRPPFKLGSEGVRTHQNHNHPFKPIILRKLKTTKVLKVLNFMQTNITVFITSIECLARIITSQRKSFMKIHCSYKI